jgi:hypothetical protein
MGIILYVGTSFFIYSILKNDLKNYYPQFYRLWYFDFLFGALGGITG